MVSFDASSFKKGTETLLQRIQERRQDATFRTGLEVLRLSSREVPHDTGELQNSGHVQQDNGDSIVGYNKVYAARLHEHPEYHFQKGRKGKYLEDPIKRNLQHLLEYLGNALR